MYRKPPGKRAPRSIGHLLPYLPTYHLSRILYHSTSPNRKDGTNRILQRSGRVSNGSVIRHASKPLIGDHVPQPIADPLSSRGLIDELRSHGEQCQLTLTVGEALDDVGSVAGRRIDVTTVDHGFVHEVNLGVRPGARRRVTRGNGVDQILAMGENALAEGGLDRRFGSGHVGGIHLGPDVTTGRGAGVIHLGIAQGRLGHDHQVMAEQRRVTAVVPVVEVGNPPVDAADLPVIAQPEVFEGSILNCDFLRRGHNIAEVLTPEDASVILDASQMKHCQNGVSNQDLLGSLITVEQENIVFRKRSHGSVFRNFHALFLLFEMWAWVNGTRLTGSGQIAQKTSFGFLVGSSLANSLTVSTDISLATEPDGEYRVSRGDSSAHTFECTVGSIIVIDMASSDEIAWGSSLVGFERIAILDDGFDTLIALQCTEAEGIIRVNF